ncbi:lipid II-degrading bacteriocin [Rhizobium ruizarguesonis]|uniref:lipid II-degrading bacteriocin n=1 Tax=Rhizobium ruizarguesonis TaxID=2081791 RepID=UPI00102F552F|nr:lipid II-degrading bacteriocin [Rhizobium ruizarguesonis]TBA07730.1 lipid II-degrading bacteriocin [Rhizobium ruizarguesonis]
MRLLALLALQIILLCDLLAQGAAADERAVGALPGAFDVTSSGSSSYSIPIKIAPGTSGTQPKIQLVYSSQNLGGPLGAGWSISGLSAITRGPKDKFVDGVAGATNLDDNDALYLDGQRIVPIGPSVGTGSSKTLEYRKVDDDFTEIVQYGPDLNHSYFRVRTKGGVTLIFGNPEISVIGDPTSPDLDATIHLHDGSVLAYAESVAADTVGNFIELSYQKNGFGDYNISNIYYTGHGSFDAKSILHVDRGFYAAISFRYTSAPRPLEVYIGGQVLRKDQQLTDVYSCVSDEPISKTFSCPDNVEGDGAAITQAAHYRLDYESVDTASRFVLKTVHMFGSDNVAEIEPTNFDYTRPTLGWDKNAISIPSGLILAASDKVARGYRFTNIVPGSTGGRDLLFSVEEDGKKVAYAFQNNGPASWTAGGQPWSPASKSATSPGGTSQFDFEPPVPFVSEDGTDLGVALIDVDGSGRPAVLQSNMIGSQESKSSYLPGATTFEKHPEYNLPFVLTRDGHVIANYLTGNWIGGGGPDLIYESEGRRGFLQNLGPASGWRQRADYLPPIPIDERAHLVDLDCSGGRPALLGVVVLPDGTSSWKVFRFGSGGWEEETDAKFLPPFPASINPAAVREVRLDGPASKCSALLVATAEGAGVRGVFLPSADGWQEISSKVPPFDLVSVDGTPSQAVVLDLKGDGFDGILASTKTPSGSISFVYSQDDQGWHDESQRFKLPSFIASSDPTQPVTSFVGPIVGQGGSDIAILNDQQVAAADIEGTNRQFGKFFTNDGSSFEEQTAFAPPIPFAARDKQDLGVRFIDLHGTGLPDAIFSRLVTRSGKTYLETGAYQNTSRGWIPTPGICTNSSIPFDLSDPNPAARVGLCPPVPFAGPQMTGNPVQFVDLDGDGYTDLLYSYQDSSAVVTKIYFNKEYFDSTGAAAGRSWVDAASDPAKYSKYIPPQSVFPFSKKGTGDQGVRFAKLSSDRVGVLIGRRGPCVLVTLPFGSPRCVAVGTATLQAFLFDGTTWRDAPNYAPPLPFVTQYDSPTGPAIDLFVQMTDVDGSGLPDLVANFTEPGLSNVVNGVWINTGSGWRASSLTVPQALDVVYRQPKTLVQWADVNGDGLPDVVMTDGASPGGSKTWLGTGKGWALSPNWQVPAAAISTSDGDPGFRLVDTKGDGYQDILWMRPAKADGSGDRGLLMNDGHGWSKRADNLVPRGLIFTDRNGVDQGVRLLSVTGKGLTDIVASFEGGLQEVHTNRARRADILAQVTDGYGIKTEIRYQTLLERDGSDNASGVVANPLGWRGFERETPDDYPTVAPVPTSYVVRQVVVDAADGIAPVTVDYRYGKYQVDADASRPLGFAWRESLNEYSRVLTRQEMLQDARAHPGVTHETSCIADLSALERMRDTSSGASVPTTSFPANLCPQGATVQFDWGYRISETSSCWSVFEGDLNGTVNELRLPESECGQGKINGPLRGTVIRQVAIASQDIRAYEVDGYLISSEINEFEYDVGKILERHGNVISVVTKLADGSSTQTINEYADNQTNWLFGRLISSTVSKQGDLVGSGPDRASEIKKACFDYDSATGLLNREIANCGTNREVRTFYTHDRFGNIVGKTISTDRFPDQAFVYEYGDRFSRFITASVDPLGHGSRLETHAAFGEPLVAVDPNGLKISYHYDAFGRLAKQTAPSGITTFTDLVDARTPGALPVYDGAHDIAFGLSAPARYAVRSKIEGLPATWVLFDAKGRELRRVSDAFTVDPATARYVFTEARYNSLGRIVAASLPHEALAPPSWTLTEYDDLGRACASTAINGLRTETLYTGAPEGGAKVTVVVDPASQLSQESSNGAHLLSCGHQFQEGLYRPAGLNQITTSTLNMRKQIVESSDALGKVSFTYDAGGRKIAMLGPTGAETTYTYDEFGNSVRVSDPDLGTWTYQYDAFGRPTAQTDAKGQRTALEYDLLGRPKTRISGDVVSSWTYDEAAHGIGLISSAASSNGYSERFVYDELSRLSIDSVTIGNENYSTSLGYDKYGRAEKITYPNLFAVQNVFDQKGFLTSVVDPSNDHAFWKAREVDAFGRVTKEEFGNGVVTTKRYRQEDQRLDQISAVNGEGKRVLDLALDYDLIGNLTSRSEAGRKETFSYDVLNRLSKASKANGGVGKFTYDAAGRMTYKSGVGAFTYAEAQGGGQGDAFQPYHAVLRTGEGGGAQSYQYDANGNMRASPGAAYGYTSDNRLKLAYHDSFKWMRFDYGPNGDRFRQSSRESGEYRETLYVGLYERVTDFSPFTNFDLLRPDNFTGFERSIIGRNYISNGSEIIGVVETNEHYANNLLYNPDSDPSRFFYGKRTQRLERYFSNDQLGSTLRVTDAKGKVQERFWYDAWGASSGSDHDDVSRGFTGHEQLDSFNLIHMNGRVYNPILAKFLSADPINQMVNDTQSGNAYSYARNNPLRYVDPTGLSWISDAWDAVSGAAGDVWHGITHFAGEVGKWFHENWRTVVVIAVVIVVTVYTGGLGTGPAYAILAGVAGGAAGGAVGAALYGGSPDDIIQAAIKGGVIGGISAGAFYGVGEAFSATEATSTVSQVESMAAHGVVGGARSSAEGGDFWKGFVATAATKASSLYGPRFETYSANIARAAGVGGTVSAISGGKFYNGAITGAFSFAFNDALHSRYTTWQGFRHYLFGDGSEVEISAKQIENISSGDLTKSRQISLSIAMGDGEYSIDDKFYYGTKGEDSRYLVGNVQANIRGDLSVSGGVWQFSGSVSYSPDLYDMNASNRAWLPETMTTIGRGMGYMTGAKDYKIQIEGKQSNSGRGYYGP